MVRHPYRYCPRYSQHLLLFIPRLCFLAHLNGRCPYFLHLFDEEVAVKAKIYTIGGFSAHADQKELLDWLGTFANKPEVFVVHAEEAVALEFADLVGSKLGCKVHVPTKGEEFTI